MLNRLRAAAADRWRERRVTEREARSTPGYEEARRIHESRPTAARSTDEAATAERVTTDIDEYRRAPNRVDYAHVDTEKSRSVRHPDYPGHDPAYHHGGHPSEGGFATMERLGTIAPVLGNPSLDPAGGDMIAVSYMAGYGGEAAVGFDAMDGIDSLVTGDVDANTELRVESATGGPDSGPMTVEPDESVYSDDHGRGTHGLSISAEEAGANCDWCRELHGEAGRRQGDFDWTGWL